MSHPILSTPCNGFIECMRMWIEDPRPSFQLHVMDSAVTAPATISASTTVFQLHVMDSIPISGSRLAMVANMTFQLHVMDSSIGSKPRLKSFHDPKDSFQLHVMDSGKQ